jgi:hypothetical protein
MTALSGLAAAAAFATALGLPCSGAFAQDAPAADVVGLQAGMSYDAIATVLKSRGELSSIETARQWIRESHGVQTRQLLRASDGIDCAAGVSARKARWHVDCDTFGSRFQARKDVANQIIVAFTGMPGDETAASVWRRTVFPEGASPSISAIEEALVQKYGKPHIRQTDSGYYSMSHRSGATMLNWIYTPDGKWVGASDALKSRCVNGPKPWFAASHSWNGACGLTIRAEILPIPGQRLLAQELNVTLVRQKDLIDALAKFDADLKLAVQGSADNAATKPDL